MRSRFAAAVLALAALPALCADWNPKLAEQYLDSRQKAWAAWPSATKSGVVCVSCHTTFPYMLARPALRQALGESGPTLYEGMLVSGLRATVFRTDAKDLLGTPKGLIADQVYGAQAVLAALVIAMDDAQHGRMSPEGEKALERMWSVQVRDGKDKGAWLWSDFDLDPWETKDAAYYGGALGAVATGVAPEAYQARPEIRDNIAALKTYLRDGQSSQPLHNRLFVLWASAKLHGLLTDSDRQAVLDELWKKQQPDGGWTIESLGEFKKRADAPPSNGSNSYATAVAVFNAVQAGVDHSNPNLARGLAWLKSHQDAQSGRWTAESMNHSHEAGSMPALFMSDAATSYATAALLAAEQPAHHAQPTARITPTRATRTR
jgi:squalene-hopene/tetraprenyl-beta-curcumene cyclase